jgi:hypothetical protein
MPQWQVICYLGISFNMDSSWMSWTPDIEIVSEILVESILFGHGIGAIGKFISSSFRAYVERPNLISYASYTSI